MKKRTASFLLALLMAMLTLLSACGGTASEVGATTAPAVAATVAPTVAPTEAAKEKVDLTMASWRTDDKTQMDEFLGLYSSQMAPNVTITFQPINPPDYNATLRMQLESGTAPDLLYARSYGFGQDLFKSGYFADCSDIPGINDNFSDSNKAPWQMPDGKMFAVPFAAVSHGVYYNKDIFEKAGVSVPATWGDFITVCKKLKDAGYTPLANGLADQWDILECFFLGMLPNYVGGADQRVLYENGTKKLNDQNFVDAYTDIAGVKPYLPNGFEAVTYNDSQALFSSEGAAMFIDGSWTISVYKDVSFKWGVFAVPPRSGRENIITFHPDSAITMNAATKHPEEAKAFLAWMCTEDGAKAAASNLPTGFFPMIKFQVTLQDEHANEFLALNNGKKTDARFVWPVLMDQYAPMNTAVISVIKGDMKPQQAADSVLATIKAK
jgi:raffinose/stachyose/melibiose transport system substrate-binding protein